MDATVRQQILSIRDSGQTNMFDIQTVQWIANQNNYFELVHFIEEHKSEYTRSILQGDDEDGRK